MDLALIGGVNPPDAAFEPARYAMGDTLRFAERMNLIAMEPRDDLSSTRYTLASPGEEYLVLQPNEKGGPFTVMLEPGTYSAVVQHRQPPDDSRAGKGFAVAGLAVRRLEA